MKMELWPYPSEFSFVLLFSLRTDLIIVTLQFFSEVVLGEHVVGRDPDCNGGAEKRKCAPKRLTRKVAKFKTHEKFTTTKGNNKYDIALLRLEKEVPLFSDNPKVL